MKNILITIAAVVLVGCGNPEADRALLKAAEKGNIKAVKQAIADGADVNANDKDFVWTPLHYAVRHGHKEIAELLIEKGANVNAKNKYRTTPLHRAAAWDHKEVAELLIAEGADVNARDNGGRTPLDWDDDEVADLLRKHGAK